MNPENDAKRPCLLYEKLSVCPLCGTVDYAAEGACPGLLVFGSEDIQSHRHVLAFRRESNQPCQKSVMPVDRHRAGGTSLARHRVKHAQNRRQLFEVLFK